MVSHCLQGWFHPRPRTIWKQTEKVDLHVRNQGFESCTVPYQLVHTSLDQMWYPTPLILFRLKYGRYYWTMPVNTGLLLNLFISSSIPDSIGQYRSIPSYFLIYFSFLTNEYVILNSLIWKNNTNSDKSEMVPKVSHQYRYVLHH